MHSREASYQPQDIGRRRRGNMNTGLEGQRPNARMLARKGAKPHATQAVATGKFTNDPNSIRLHPRLLSAILINTIMIIASQLLWLSPQRRRHRRWTRYQCLIRHSPINSNMTDSPQFLLSQCSSNTLRRCRRQRQCT